MVRTNPRDFILGTNYWPRRKAMTWWKEFDHAEVGAELEEIRDLGLGLVRIFLLWEDFQPQPNRLDDRSLRNLEVVLNTAAAVGLKVLPTFFTGYACGANWIPSWALGDVQLHRRFPHITEGQQTTRGIRDLYADPEMLEAQLLQVGIVTGYFARHRAIFGWDLGNEHDNLLLPRSALQGRQWLEQLCAEIRRNDAHHPVTLGLHAEDLERDRHVRPADVAPYNDFLSMHGAAFDAPWSRGPLDTDVPPFLIALTAALGGKPILCDGFVICTAPEGYPPFGQLRAPGNIIWATEEEAARYCGVVLEKLQQVGAIGALAWCFSDYDPCLWDEPPLDFAVHERHCGLTTSEGELKAAGAVLRDFARAQPQRITPTRTVPLDLTPAEYYRAPATHIAQLYEAFVREGEKGKRVKGEEQA